ncbi:MAG: hypothetical protein E7448_04215 [Ruminococcaceae bacterium]|nr:hypothetical protein [Oscillospiraceae bacterium]
MKNVCLFLIVVLLLGCFAGCQEAQEGTKGPIQNEDGTLADWMKREIERNGRDVTWYEDGSPSGYRYYGTENGYVFLFIAGGGQMTTTKVIGNCRFTYPIDFYLTAYKDGEFYWLEDLYNEGILSDECIARICDAHYGQGTAAPPLATVPNE